MNRFENGFHSFKKAIIGLTKDKNSIDEFDLKEIIINFHHSTEVLFKYILFNKHSLFIYNDIDKLFEQNFDVKLGISKNTSKKNQIELKTITYNDTIKRMLVICEETIDKYTYNKFKTLNKFRNSLTHDELNLIKEDVEQLIISVLPTVIMILHNYLPEENKEKLIEFIEDEEIVTKLNNLYTDNKQWRIITIINLLTAYNSFNDYNTSINKITQINKMLSLLGCEINEDDIWTRIDGLYYYSTASYLKKEVCDYIMFSNIIKEISNDYKMKELLCKNEIITNACKEYIFLMFSFLTELLDIDKSELTDLMNDDNKVNSYFDKISLINKIDIYNVLYYMKKMSESYVNACDSKKGMKEFMKEIVIYEKDDKIENELNAYDIYMCLIRWFKEETWYDELNFKEVYEEAMNIFTKDNYLSSEIEEEVSNHIYKSELFHDLIGDFGEWRSIDYIDQHYIEGIDIIIKDVNSSTDYTLILDVSVSVKTYIDHDYYDNGTESTYVAVNGQITEDNKFSINNIEYLGKKISVNNLGFE